MGRELGSSWFGFGVKYVADMIVKAGGGKYEGNILNIPPTPTLPNPFHIIVIVVITTTKRSLSRHRHVITTHMSRLPVGFARNDNRRRRREPRLKKSRCHVLACGGSRSGDKRFQYLEDQPQNTNSGKLPYQYALQRHITTHLFSCIDSLRCLVPLHPSAPPPDKRIYHSRGGCGLGVSR